MSSFFLYGSWGCNLSRYTRHRTKSFYLTWCIPSKQNSRMTQISILCISREKHKLYTQDRNGRFSSIVSIPSDMFNGDMYFLILLMQMIRNSTSRTMTWISRVSLVQENVLKTFQKCSEILEFHSLKKNKEFQGIWYKKLSRKWFYDLTHLFALINTEQRPKGSLTIVPLQQFQRNLSEHSW